MVKTRNARSFPSRVRLGLTVKGLGFRTEVLLVFALRILVVLGLVQVLLEGFMGLGLLKLFGFRDSCGCSGVVAPGVSDPELGIMRVLHTV